MKRHKRARVKELWLNRPWVYIPAVIKYMIDFPYKPGRDIFSIWLRNCLYLNWQVDYKEVKR